MELNPFILYGYVLLQLGGMRPHLFLV